MTEWLSSAVNLGIGGLSVAGLVFTTVKFLEKMEAMQRRYLESLEAAAKRHEGAMKEREDHARDIETHVRQTVTTALTQNTIALTESAKVLGRAVNKLDAK